MTRLLYGEAVGVRRPERCRNEMRFEEREEETRTSPRQTEVEALEGGCPRKLSGDGAKGFQVRW